MRAGYAIHDISPSSQVTLSGFVARCNRPSVGVHDPISVRVLAVDDGHGLCLVINYDLLAIGEALLARLEAAVTAIGLDSTKCVFCCTHTHSAPSAILLLGGGIEDNSYWIKLEDCTQKACKQALASMVTAVVSYATLNVPGQNFNRRIHLADGRVVLKTYPGDEVTKTGPTWDRFSFSKFESSVDGSPIVSTVHWAAHPTTAATQMISGDFPALLTTRLSQREGGPFMYLQGAAGDLSVPVTDMTFADTERTVDSIMTALPPIRWQRAETGIDRVWVRKSRIILKYKAMPADSELERLAEAMNVIVESGSGNSDALFTLGNILNIRRDQVPQQRVLRHTASVIRDWARGAKVRRSDLGRGCPLGITFVRLGPLTFAFIAAEVFVETAIKIDEKLNDSLFAVVGYAAPLVGYLPTDEALNEGGYEAEFAYRFFGHPASFAPGSEARLVQEIVRAVSERE